MGISIASTLCLLFIIFVSFAFTNSVNAIRLFLYLFG